MNVPRKGGGEHAQRLVVVDGLSVAVLNASRARQRSIALDTQWHDCLIAVFDQTIMKEETP